MGGRSNERHEYSCCPDAASGPRALGRPGAVSRTRKKLGITASSVTAPCMTKGTHSPKAAAVSPPTAGPASMPMRCTPNMLVICRARDRSEPVSAMTVRRLTVHICCPQPPMKR